MLYNLKGKKRRLKWDEIYILAKKYYEHHGNLKMPRNFKTTDGIKYDEDGINLHHWIIRQRQKSKKGELSQDKIEKLKKLV